jgi:hypothetical protein
VKASEFKMTSGAQSGHAGGSARTARPAGPVPGGWPQPGSPGQLPAYKLTVRVIAELYPPLTNERRWGFQNAIASRRGRGLIRAAARWDKLDEATVTIECRARDAVAAAEAAATVIRQTATLIDQIGVRDIKVTRVTPAG